MSDSYRTTYRLVALLVVDEPNSTTIADIGRRWADLDIEKAVTVEGRRIGPAAVESLELDLVRVERAS